MQPPPSYATDLPSEVEVQERLAEAVDTWNKLRNPFIERFRKYMTGRNEIKLPRARGYTPKAVNTFLLASVMNQKLARFGHLPSLALIPWSEGTTERGETEKMEAGLNALFDELEERAGARVWPRAVMDALGLGEGVIRIDRAPAAFWPDLVPDEEGKDKFLRLFEQDEKAYRAAREEYKRTCGLPIRWEHVPLEQWFPIYENDVWVEGFEVEQRSLRSVLNNPLFDTSELESGLGAVNERYQLSTMVSILRYANQGKQAIYAYAGATRTNKGSFPDPTQIGNLRGGRPVLLHETDTHLGRLPYVRIPGRFGGWIEAGSSIEQVMNACMHLNQIADEMMSQAVTNIRVRYWPTTVTYYSRDRTQDATKGLPKPQPVQEGGNIAMWADERVELMFQAQDDPMFTYVFEKLQGQMSQLGGSPAIFGMRQAGVYTGYQENLQITQSESLDDMIAKGLKEGITDAALLVIAHVKAMDETLYVEHVTEDKDGKKYRKEVTIDPDKLKKLPKMDAQVTRPRPIDKVAALRAALDASAEREGKGPLLSDDTIREQILALEDPAKERRKLLIQTVENEAIRTGVLNQMVLAKLNLRIAEGQAPGNFNPDADVDPAFIAGMDGLIEGREADASGGVDPRMLGAIMQRKGGVPAGQPQPEQQVGRAVQIQGGAY